MRIKLENLKKYYDSIHAVDGISLDIPENTIFGIIGRSGAGKSSLVRLMSLLEAPDSGAVWYGDRRVDNLPKDELIACRRKIGMIFQNFNLFSSRNAGKNVAYPLEICGMPKAQIKERVVEMLKLVGLEDRINAPISTLSGGQKQRVAIARALATQPDILYCDEATSALDPNTTQSILALIREIQKKMNLTVVMITHQMEVVRDACESVAVIEDGKVVEQGLVKDIFANPKTKTTRDFIKNVLNDKEMVKWSDQTGKFHLHFTGKTPDKPLLSMISKKFDVEFNIFAAGISHLPEEDVGYMNVDIMGSDEEVSKVVSWLEENSVHVRREQE
ncbi:MAG: methionine ABC transporter ATP-binding protein [Spirochaetia bacterium]|nr:methionine ABC transporter ATP-binding protein [Spirochaetia bacterium]